MSCFHVKNHGVPVKMMNNAILMAREFFKLPENGRMKYYSDDNKRSIRLSTSFSLGGRLGGRCGGFFSKV